MQHHSPEREAGGWEESRPESVCGEAVPAQPAPNCGGQSCSVQKWRRGSWTSTR